MRLHALLLLAALAAAVIACEGHPGRKLGFRTTDGGDLVLHYDPCNESDATVTGLKLVEVRGRVYGDDDDRVLWEVESRTGVAATQFRVGVLPPGFVEKVALSETPLRSSRLGIFVYTTAKRASDTFRLADLRSDFVLSRGELLTEDTFYKRSTCV